MLTRSIGGQYGASIDSTAIGGIDENQIFMMIETIEMSNGRRSATTGGVLY